MKEKIKNIVGAGDSARPQKRNTQKGITLIALIISIIVMLILAAVSINIIINQGIINKTQDAANTHNIAAEKEAIEIAYSKYLTEKYNGETPTLTIADSNATVTGNEESGWTITYTNGNVYKLSKNGGIEGPTNNGGGITVGWTDNGDGTITKGATTLSIGDYVAYDATKDENGNTVATTSYTSYSEANASADKNDGRSSGYTSDQVFKLNKDDGTPNYIGGWRVLGVNNGQLQLISADVIRPDSGGYAGSNKYYYLKGQKGYTDGPGELNAIAGMYGQGKGATGARSINIDDVNKITGYDPSNTGDGKPYGSGRIDEYNNKVTYYWDGTTRPYYEYGEGASKKSGKLSDAHNNSFNWYDGSSWQSSAKSTTATTSAREKITDLTSNYYWYYPTTLTTSYVANIKGIAKTSKEWKVLFNDTYSKHYWLASPYVDCLSDSSGFGMRTVYDEHVYGHTLFYSYDNSYNRFNCVRPVVTLKSDVQIEKTETNDGSILEKACIIK